MVPARPRGNAPGPLAGNNIHTVYNTAGGSPCFDGRRSSTVQIQFKRLESTGFFSFAHRDPWQAEFDGHRSLLRLEFNAQDALAVYTGLRKEGLVDSSGQISERLRTELNAEFVDVEDEGHLHIGHAGEGQGHYRVTVVAEAFAGKSLVERHQLVYKAMGSLMNQIHALAIRAITPDQWQR
jgi:BolA family transcriptional regulator, general stress-responsive regulator